MQQIRWWLLLAGVGSCLFVASARPCVGQLVVVQSVAERQITVRLIDGKSGKPVADQNFTAAWGRAGRAVIRTNARGEGVVSLPSDAKVLTLIAGPKKGKEPYRIPYLSCSGNALAFLDVDAVLASGLAPENECSTKIKVTPRPGEVIDYVLPLPWYYLDWQ